MTTQTIRILAAIALVATLAASAEAYRNQAYKYHANQTLHRRPQSATDRTLAISNYRITNVPRDHKGMNISTTTLPDGTSRAYRTIAIWHCEIAGVWRSGPGIHSDFIQIRGQGTRQDVPTTVMIQDINIHDGDGIPIMIQDGTFDRITLRDVRIRNTTRGVQISAMNVGSIGSIVIDKCPNIGVAIMGRPGAIGTVYIKNSPGIRIADTPTRNGRSGCKIVYLK